MTRSTKGNLLTVNTSHGLIPSRELGINCFNVRDVMHFNISVRSAIGTTLSKGTDG